MRYTATFASFLVLFTCADRSALAQASIPQKDVCIEETIPGGVRYRLHAGRFLAWLLEKNAPVSWQCIDKDGNGGTAQRAQLLLSFPSLEGRTCTPEDRENINRAKLRVSGIVKGLEDGLIPQKIIADARPIASLGERDLLQQNPSVVILCSRIKQEASKKPDPGKADKISDLKLGGWKVKLRGDQDSLEYDNKSENYKKKATSAQISVLDNKLTAQTKFNIKATVGLDSGPAAFEIPRVVAGSYRLIPYVKFEDQAIRPPVVKPKGADEREIELTTVGLIGSVYFQPAGLPLISKLTFDPQYIEDGQVDSKVFGATVKWSPTLLFGSNSFPPGDVLVGNLFFYHVYLSGVARLAEVLEAGANPTLLKTSDFAYYGGEARLVLTGKSETPLEPFKVDLRYHYLWREHGPDVAPERFTAGLTYTLDKDGNLDFGVTWDTGRDYETLQQRRQLMTSIGYKF